MDYRRLFEGVDAPIYLENGCTVRPIQFDNAATTPAFKEIIQKIPEWLQHYGPIGRGTGQKGDWSSYKYEEVKKSILSFLHVDRDEQYQVVYTKNATEGLNLLACTLITAKTDEVLISRMEHHANDLPWRMCAKVHYVEVDEKGRVQLDRIEEQLRKANGRIKCVSLTGASNVTGYVTPIHEVAALCHRYQAKLIVDAAQLVAHRPIYMLGDTPQEAIDFLVFSGHKMYAPFGSGCVVGRFESIQQPVPLLWGGGMVEWVSNKAFKVEDSPILYEAGTQNLIGVLAIETAIQNLEKIGFQSIEAHEKMLQRKLIQEMAGMSHVMLYGDTEVIDDRLGVVAFNIKGKRYMDVATFMAEQYGIATRCGKFCAHPYVDRLLMLETATRADLLDYYGEYGMIRASLGLYNTIEEVETFLACIQQLKYQR